MTDQTTIDRKIALLKKHTDELALLTPTDEGIADAVGLTREIEVQLASIRHAWEKVAVTEIAPAYQDDSRKVTPVATGAKYELVPQTKVVRSYNSPAILVALMDAEEGRTLTDALTIAREADAVRLTWRLTELKNLMRQERAALKISFSPVNDFMGVDGSQIGETETPNGVKRVKVSG